MDTGGTEHTGQQKDESKLCIQKEQRMDLHGETETSRIRNKKLNASCWELLEAQSCKRWWS